MVRLGPDGLGRAWQAWHGYYPALLFLRFLRRGVGRLGIAW